MICSICKKQIKTNTRGRPKKDHPLHEAIVIARLAGRKYKDIADNYKVGLATVHRAVKKYNERFKR